MLAEFALQATFQGLRTFIINLEMSPEEYTQRLCMNILGEVSFVDGECEEIDVPYFEKGYAEDGYSRDEYNSHPALQKTAEQFSNATEEMVDFAGRCLENN